MAYLSLFPAQITAPTPHIRGASHAQWSGRMGSSCLAETRGPLPSPEVGSQEGVQAPGPCHHTDLRDGRPEVSPVQTKPGLHQPALSLRPWLEGLSPRHLSPQTHLQVTGPDQAPWPYTHISLLHLASWLCLLPLSVPATRASSLFRQHTRHSAASGPLHGLSPPPAMCFLQMVM